MTAHCLSPERGRRLKHTLGDNMVFRGNERGINLLLREFMGGGDSRNLTSSEGESTKPYGGSEIFYCDSSKSSDPPPPHSAQARNNVQYLTSQAKKTLSF